MPNIFKKNPKGPASEEQMEIGSVVIVGNFEPQKPKPRFDPTKMYDGEAAYRRQRTGNSGTEKTGSK